MKFYELSRLGGFLSIFHRVVWGLAVGSLVATAYAVESSGNAPTRFARGPQGPESLLVRFHATTSDADIDALQSHFGGAVDYRSTSITGLRRVLLPPGTDVSQVLNTLRKSAKVIYALRDRKVRLYQVNDAAFGQQWALNNTRQTIFLPNTPGVSGSLDADINAIEAWDHAPANARKDVVVAVVDSGVQYTHPDLKNNMWVNTLELANGVNGIDDDGNGYVDDFYGIDTVAGSGDPMPAVGSDHGTHIAGTIAAVGNNLQGGVGVAPNAKILACNFYGKNNTSGGGQDSDAIKCFDYVYAMKKRGEPIIAVNASWGGPGYSEPLEDAIAKLRSVGVLVITAAGNESAVSDALDDYPSTSKQSNVINVAATNLNDGLASFSNYGERSVHVGAPGLAIYSTVSGGAYGYLHGTSMAAPHVSGLAALLAGYDSGRDWRAIRNLIIAGGTPLDALNKKTISGRRIRAWDINGKGSLTCNNQRVTAVVSPSVAEHVQRVGTTLTLRILNINCDRPAGAVTVTTTGYSAVAPLELKDDGVAPDQEAGDGIYSGNWVAPLALGEYVLSFNGAVIQRIIVMNPDQQLAGAVSYSDPISTTYRPRISNEPFKRLTGGTWERINAPNPCFQINVGGQLFPPPYYMTPFGVLSMQIPAVLNGVPADRNEPASLAGTFSDLPNSQFYTFLAPYWGIFGLPVDARMMGAEVRWWYDCAVAGPEFVVEWKGHNTNVSLTTDTFDVQMIFRKGSSEIEVHYIAIPPDAPWGTIGMQVDDHRATQQAVFSGNTKFQAGTAWIWRTATGAPSAGVNSVKRVLVGEPVSLAGPTLAAGTKYYWQQVSGTPVGLFNATSLNPTFTAPNSASTLQFQLVVANAASQVASSLTTVRVYEKSAAGQLQMNSSKVAVNERNRTITVSVQRVNGDVGPLQVSYSTTQTKTAVPDQDYTAVSGTLSWAADESAPKNIVIPILDDRVPEALKAFDVNITGANVDLARATTQVDIVDNDFPGVLAFESAKFNASEGDGKATIKVVRLDGDMGAVSVSYSSIGGRAILGKDYEPVSGVLEWGDGESAEKTFTIPILQDNLFEDDEDIQVELNNPAGGAQAGLRIASVIIRDYGATNHAPGVPELVAPIDGAGNVNVNTVNFEWQSVTDPEGDVVRYALQYCATEDFVGCEAQSTESLAMGNWAVPASGGLSVILIGMLATGSRRYRRVLLSCAVVVSLGMNACSKPGDSGGNGGGNGEVSLDPRNRQVTVHGLKTATQYYWRIIASDGKGGETASAVNRFTTSG